MESLAKGRLGLFLVLGVVLLLRVPFLNQAIQGDDPVYLAEASHALIDPLHPDHTLYVFRGKEVDMRGLSHPPMNGWILAGLLTVFGDVKEVPFHAAYIVFSLIAAGAVWSLARRFTEQPLWAALLFVAVPAFVVNGSSLETDLPFLAFWLASIALFTRPVCTSFSLCASAGFMFLAALTAYQAVFLTPILAVYVWLFHRRSLPHWLTTLAAPITFVAWQLFERFSTGAAPAAVLAGYFQSYGFQALEHKLANGLALFIHSWFIVFPALVPFAFLYAWRRRREPQTHFLLAWIGLFFAGALVVFFVGSARYLLPMAAPIAILASRVRTRWLVPAFAIQMTLSLGLAVMNYQHWGAIRAYAESIRPAIQNQRVWVDDEWGLRHYMQQQGARPLTASQRLRGDDIVVSGQLSHAINITDPVAPVGAPVEVRPSIPLRIIGLETHSGYSAAAIGRLWPFGISSGVVDRLSAVRIIERHPTLEYLDIAAPEAKAQIVTGIWPDDHWMSGTGVVVLKSPAEAMPLSVRFYIPDNAPARRVSLLLDGQEVAARTMSAPGVGEISSSPVKPAGASAVVEVRVDRTFKVSPDVRDLGMVLTGVGFRQ